MMATQLHTGEFGSQPTQFGIPGQPQQNSSVQAMMKAQNQDNSLVMGDLTQSMGSMNLVDPTQSQVNKF